MATKESAVGYDLPFIDLVYDYLPKKMTSKLNKQTVVDLAKSGLIQRDRLVEIAMTAASGGLYEMDSAEGRDHSDGSDTKTATVRWMKSGYDVYQYQYLKAQIKNLNTKLGSLRLVIYNPEAERGENKFKFVFVRHFNAPAKHSSIFIPWEGNSKYKDGLCGLEVDSFEELAKMTEDKFDGARLDV